MDMVAFGPSIGIHDQSLKAWPGILQCFDASDGMFVLQVGREHQFEALADLIGCSDWKTDERFSTRKGWSDHTESVIRPAVEAWAADKTKLEASRILAESGVVAGPSYEGHDLLADPHVQSHDMICEVPVEGRDQPVRVHGNPIKFSESPEGPATKWPLVGEHTHDLLRADLDLSDADLEALRCEGVIA